MNSSNWLQDIIRTFPTQKNQDEFVIPTFYNERTETVMVEPYSFLLEIQNNVLADHYLSHDRAKDYYNNGTGLVGKKTPVSPRTISTYCNYLHKFLVWCEYKGAETCNYEKYDPKNLSAINRFDDRGSLEEYRDDLLNDPKWSSKNPSILKTHTAVVNSYILFLYAYGARQHHFEPYNFAIPRSYAATDGMKPQQVEFPYPTSIKAWIQSIDKLNHRVILGLICFGGLRADEVLNLRRGDIPVKVLEQRSVPVGEYGKRIQLFLPARATKGSKARYTSIPRFVMDDLKEYYDQRQSIGVKLKREGREIARASKDEYLLLNFHNKVGAKSTIGLIKKAFEDCPFEGWSPHKGRHAFAVNRLAELMALQQGGVHEGNLSSAEKAERALLTQTPLQELRDEMGHVSEKTTDIYLKGARRRNSNTEIRSFLDDLKEFYA